jgi:hypothetical protein
LRFVDLLSDLVANIVFDFGDLKLVRQQLHKQLKPFRNVYALKRALFVFQLKQHTGRDDISQLPQIAYIVDEASISEETFVLT